MPPNPTTTEPTSGRPCWCGGDGVEHVGVLVRGVLGRLAHRERAFVGPGVAEHVGGLKPQRAAPRHKTGEGQVRPAQLQVSDLSAGAAQAVGDRILGQSQ